MRSTCDLLRFLADMPMQDLNLLSQKWLQLLCPLGVAEAPAWQALADIAEHYSGPGRFYHNLDHVRNMLDIIDSLAPLVSDFFSVQMAAWLHDVVYDSKASDNEERSADYARRLLQALSLPPAEHTAQLILKTKTHAPDGDPDAEVLLDADLAILGASASLYDRYAEQIRQEYAWVPDEEYRTGRSQVLTRFLQRPRIYSLLTSLETPARDNLQRELARLSTRMG